MLNKFSVENHNIQIPQNDDVKRVRKKRENMGGWLVGWLVGWFV